MHQRGEHGLRGLRELPLRRYLGTEIGEGFNRSQEPTEIFFCCHLCGGNYDQSNLRVARANVIAAKGVVG